MSIKCVTNRRFDSINVKAEWSKIDRIVQDIVNKDRNNEIDAIGKETASFEHYITVSNPMVAF